MRIAVVGQGIELSAAMVRHIEGRIGFSLGTASDRISTATVRLADINGGRGGVDKRCRVVLRLRHAGSVMAQAVDPDAYAAVDEAARRAKDAIWRRLKRRRTLRREYANRGSKRLLA